MADDFRDMLESIEEITGRDDPIAIGFDADPIADAYRRQARSRALREDGMRPIVAAPVEREFNGRVERGAWVTVQVFIPAHWVNR